MAEAHFAKPERQQPIGIRNCDRNNGLRSKPNDLQSAQFKTVRIRSAVQDRGHKRSAFGEGARGCRKMDGADYVDDAIALLQEVIGLLFEVAPHNRPNAERRTPNAER
jgi:hypothetical protein